MCFTYTNTLVIYIYMGTVLSEEETCLDNVIGLQLLDMLIERYLEPLKSENHIPQEEVCTLLLLSKAGDNCCAHTYVRTCLQMEIVSGNIVEIVEIQKKFLRSLEVRIDGF